VVVDATAEIAAAGAAVVAAADATATSQEFSLARWLVIPRELSLHKARQDWL
jgi:hypothetical protein